MPKEGWSPIQPIPVQSCEGTTREWRVNPQPTRWNFIHFRHPTRFLAHPKFDEADLTPTTTLSHMEWKESSFTPSRPEQPPKITVSVEILQQTHHRFGKKSCLPTTHTTTEAVADSSFQTCAAGPELLTKLKCPRAYLVKTGHRIVGITDSILSIIGTVYLRIHRGGRLSNQMVYISENFWEFYLSQTAMKDLGIIN